MFHVKHFDILVKKDRKTQYNVSRETFNPQYIV